MPSPAQLENVARVERLAFYPILEETILMDAATPRDCWKGIKADGTYPAATTEVVRGIIHYFSEDQAPDVYASAMSEGIAIVMIEPGQTITLDEPIAINANGNAVVGVPGTDYIVGYARNPSTGSTAALPHYTEIKLA